MWLIYEMSVLFSAVGRVTLLLQRVRWSYDVDSIFEKRQVSLGKTFDVSGALRGPAGCWYGCRWLCWRQIGFGSGDDVGVVEVECGRSALLVLCCGDNSRQHNIVNLQ